MKESKKPPILLKIAYTLFLAFIVPIYWIKYGPGNFLWLSDISLFLTFFALWFASPLLISIMMLAIFPLELVWNIDFFYQILTGETLIGLAAYMFDSSLEVYLRALSLFHIFLPIIWIYYFLKWGYDKKAFKYGTLMIWIAFPLSYILTQPKNSINWVYHPQINDWTWISNIEWTLLMLLALPLCLYLPLHFLYKKISFD